MEAPHPSTLNGDLALTPAQTRAYVAYHTQRNARNAAATLAAGVETAPTPVWGATLEGTMSPSRALLNGFYTALARRLAPRMTGRPVTIVDLGCGGGARLKTFADAGFSGDFIGIDIERHPKWPTAPIAGLRPSFIRADLHTFDERTLPPIDLLISTTALEHLRDDQGIIRRFGARLAPGGVQAHFVPAEEALHLYGKHGWRFYSPICLRRMFPRGEIHRFGGVFSNALHIHAIYEPSRRARPTLPEQRPRLYAWLRAASLVLDRLARCPRPSMYAVVEHAPDGAAAGAGFDRASVMERAA